MPRRQHRSGRVEVFPPALELDVEKESARIEGFISRFVDDRGLSGIALGLSGGLDSAAVAALCERALPAGAVHALLMPERDSSPDSAADAKMLAEKLGIRHRVLDLTEALERLGCYEDAAGNVGRLGGVPRAAVRAFPHLARKGFLANIAGGGGTHFKRFVAFHRIKHRLRMVAVYREAERLNLAVASCANRTEFEIGFFVRYGDDAGDIAPIKHLYKTQVFELAGGIGVTERILEKKPSPDLFAGMKDEEIMGISYRELDTVLWSFSAGLGDREIEDRFEIDARTIEYVRDITEQSARLRDPPASLQIQRHPPPGSVF